ncbi:Cytochrome c-551 precursor [Jeotgalicoccus saudimassiliensis]|uniref:Cytochrome c-551 n=1 Tax=Jeotgalicoccus saudimassiliensis TaxID=1461582 RepID=A0A078M2T5_9STAP|nr:cytochrome c [Jeotgalicoccus saudimassiliensis]CEA00569.1 Cytochrome c-551 precursor [Jeotgalicoccus saudimassiliensis]
MSDNKKRSRGVKVDGQPRYIERNPEPNSKGTKHIYWLIPVLVVFLIVPLLIFHLGSGGGSDTAEEETATEETADSGEESGEEGGGEETASSGDVDAEGIARDNCASCHGQDFSGAMGPALAGTSLAEDEFTSIVRDGQGSMPAFSADQIADEELTALYQFFTE